MAYTKIAPFGPRNGPGTFDNVFNTEKYPSIKEAVADNEYVNIDFVVDENGIIHFEIFYSKNPKIKTYIRLQIQHFPFGVDVVDDTIAINNAIEILEKEESIKF